jgi:sec-independent protein translocase protein TatA
MFGLGFPELLLIFVIALIVFGPKKLPEIGRSVGRALAEFKKASEDFQESMKAEMKEVEKTAQLDEIKKIGQEIITDETKQASTPETAPAEQAKEQEKEKGKKENAHGNA